MKKLFLLLLVIGCSSLKNQSSEGNSLRDSFTAERACSECFKLPDGRLSHQIESTVDYEILRCRRDNELMDFIMLDKALQKWYVFETYVYDETLDYKVKWLTTIKVFNAEFNHIYTLSIVPDTPIRWSSYELVVEGSGTTLQIDKSNAPKSIKGYYKSDGMVPVINLPILEALKVLNDMQQIDIK